MECRLVLFGKRCSFALQSGSNAIQIEIVAAVVQSGLFAVDIAPIGTGLRLLIECRSIRTEKTEILDLPFPSHATPCNHATRSEEYRINQLLRILFCRPNQMHTYNERLMTNG